MKVYITDANELSPNDTLVKYDSKLDRIEHMHIKSISNEYIYYITDMPQKQGVYSLSFNSLNLMIEYSLSLKFYVVKPIENHLNEELFQL